MSDQPGQKRYLTVFDLLILMAAALVVVPAGAGRGASGRVLLAAALLDSVAFFGCWLLFRRVDWSISRRSTDDTNIGVWALGWFLRWFAYCGFAVGLGWVILWGASRVL